MSMKKILLIISSITVTILFVFILIVCAFMYIFNIVPTADGYNRATYSVVLYNETNEIQNDIKVLYGRDSRAFDSLVLHDTVNDLKPSQCIKIQIPTSSDKVDSSNNVYISVNNDKDIVSCGYFGVNTGGFAMVKIYKQNEATLIKRLSEKEFKYKKAYFMERRQQNKLTWYE